jgi:hypothetical protein
MNCDCGKSLTNNNTLLLKMEMNGCQQEPATDDTVAVAAASVGTEAMSATPLAASVHIRTASDDDFDQMWEIFQVSLLSMNCYVAVSFQLHSMRI